jgi:hypothetical protein
MILGSLPAGAIVGGVVIVVMDFFDVGVSGKLGTAADPSMILDVPLSKIGQFVIPALTLFDTPDVLQFSVDSSLVGSGFIIYKVAG